MFPQAFIARRRHDPGLFVFDNNSPAARARELFKPSQDAESLVVSIKKNLEILDLSFLWVTS